ncbi:hypothetical protein OC846_005486 [Tilletia horrida]|uniref:Uncharacterized protein n=1 Tax=Tilletia horrida TaxID=155126 RepID=A0AAN6GNF5_9BASI|nr:hypothetical protein OC846_005486 [Tilletia horrida]KAK0549489.1 hypothetical protein OC845_003108 [Tilletia horrida]KAK0561753.1 hypothetical protein OC861_005659 [Tilletia horrida]
MASSNDQAEQGSSSSTVIQSLFFQPEILSAYSRDSLQDPDYPVQEAIFLLQPLTDGVDDPCEGAQARLTPANLQALSTAVRAISSHLVLVDREAIASASTQETGSIPEAKLNAARLRVHLGVTLMLLGETTRALAQLSVASDSLRPPPKSRKPKEADVDVMPPKPGSSALDGVQETRISLWNLMERAYIATGKREDAKRVRRWRTDLEMQRPPI